MQKALFMVDSYRIAQLQSGTHLQGRPQGTSVDPSAAARTQEKVTPCADRQRHKLVALGKTIYTQPVQ